MRSKQILLAFLLLPVTLFGQSIKFPLVSSSEDPTTMITEVETNSQYTIVSFKHICTVKGSWVQLNKSMYLQDANGEERYNYRRSEGIPLRPDRFVATKDNQEVNFKVYFEKLKPGTQEINVIERARSQAELNNGVNFLNYFRVNLNQSQLELGDRAVSKVEVVVAPPPPLRSDFVTSVANGETANLGPVLKDMYMGMFTAQLNVYSNPAVIDQLAKNMKSYYDALIKVGFSSDAALKIITSKQLISAGGNSNN
ncbi:MAG: hypothetical protein P0Y49_07115 [Candidatus Pedobacter colombiensis]|uniref:Uncharacterized protein n=1 Tax=Candidatus Pedobacter colombiensis TaxID=3121371 RepID=A0AAJ5WC73_9SPHI|nr:hypothetical protein [Pedobacter sp.]WEK20905.1 MAG: hypothetical protein P0Y49_07115 [Pedobacter sp.]